MSRKLRRAGGWMRWWEAEREKNSCKFFISRPVGVGGFPGINNSSYLSFRGNQHEPNILYRSFFDYLAYSRWLFVFKG